MGPPLSAAAAPLLPFLGISAIKAVGVAPSPELGSPGPAAQRGAYCEGPPGLQLPKRSIRLAAGPGAPDLRPRPAPSTLTACDRNLLPETLLLRAVPQPRNYCVISECRLSGVSNLLGFFPTIMALSIPVFSVSSICDRCLWGEKKGKSGLLYRNHYFVCSACYSFWGGPAHSPWGLPSQW